MTHPATYEYHTLYNPNDEDLNAFGRMGWRVVSVYRCEGWVTVLLERVTQ